MTDSNSVISVNGAVNPGKRRLPELTYMNVLFTLMVISVHILSEAVTTLDRQSVQYFAVYTPWKLFQFVTQGFVFLSGVKLFISSRTGTGRFYLGRLKRVVLPYVLWVAVYYAYFVQIGYFGFDFLQLIRYIFVGDLSAQFYFVIIICQFYLITPLISRLLKDSTGVPELLYSLFISLILGQYLPQIIALFEPEYFFNYNDRLFTTYLFYFVAGCAAGKNYEKFKEMLIKSRNAIYVMFLLFAAANLTLSYLTASARIYIGWCDTLHFAYCVSAILFFMAFFTELTKKHERVPALLKKTDASSYMLYLSHVLVLLIIRRNVLDRAKVSDAGARLAVTVVLTAAFVLISVYVWEFFKKNTYNYVFKAKYKCNKTERKK